MLRDQILQALHFCLNTGRNVCFSPLAMGNGSPAAESGSLQGELCHFCVGQNIVYFPRDSPLRRRGVQRPQPVVTFFKQHLNSCFHAQLGNF